MASLVADLYGKVVFRREGFVALLLNSSRVFGFAVTGKQVFDAKLNCFDKSSFFFCSFLFFFLDILGMITDANLIDFEWFLLCSNFLYFSRKLNYVNKFHF